MRLSVLTTALSLVLVAPALAQTPPETPASATAAVSPDVASADAILAALYASISGDAGVARDWDRFRRLFHPSARLMPAGRDAQGLGRLGVLTPEDYITRAGPQLEGQGFHEREIARRTDRFGAVTHVFSTYDSRRTADGDVFARGINSIQLFDDGTRWWIVSVYWQSETPEFPLPAEYLPTSD